MYKTIYRVLPTIVKEKICQYHKQINNFRILSSDYGQWATVQDWNCWDATGNAIPWYTYPAIEYLSHLDLSGMRVFEFGSGNSTIWWSKQAKDVHSVEDDPAWFEWVEAQFVGESCHLTYELQKEKQSYIKSFNRMFDITVIDGKYRPECVERYLEFREKGGLMLVFDNSDWYPESIAKARRGLQWIELDFHGFGPINDYTWTTSIFINPEMANRLIYTKVLDPISGLKQNTESRSND